MKPLRSNCKLEWSHDSSKLKKNNLLNNGNCSLGVINYTNFDIVHIKLK